MELEGDRFEQLEQALLSAYPAEAKLKRMVRVVFGDACPTEIAWGDSLQEGVDGVIEYAEEKSKIVDLLRGAHRRNCANEQLRQLCEACRDDLLTEASHENLTSLDADALGRLISFMMQLVQQGKFEHVKKAGLSALPTGASDSDRHKYLADFQNPDLLPHIRLYGFLKLAIALFPSAHGKPTLLRFAQDLFEQLDSTSPLREPLSEWIAQVPGTESSQVSRTSPSLRTAALGRLEVSLMVTVRPSTAPLARKGQSAGGKGSLYRVNGYLFFDQISDRPHPHPTPKPLQELSLDDVADQLGVTVPWPEVPQRINQFLKQAIDLSKNSLRQELQYRDYKLTLELFLPVEHLGIDVDQWPQGDRQTPTGMAYGVIVRFCDRIDDGERQNALIQTWDKLQAYLAPPHNLQTLEAHVESPPSLSQYESWRQLEANLRQKLGLKLCCGLPADAQDQKELFTALLYSDAPVAVWTRCASWATAESGAHATQTVNLSEALSPFLAADCIRGTPVILSERLKTVRYQAWVAQQGQCIGDHMAFLLDNPDRLPIPPLLAS